MATFTPPTYPEGLPPTLPADEHSLSYKLFRHYRGRPEGRNVYIYSNDTVSEADPDGYSTLWREADRTSSTLANAPTVSHVFWGGHEAETVTSAEEALLIAAGYTVD